MDCIPKLQKHILGQRCTTPHLKAMLTTDTQTVGLSKSDKENIDQQMLLRSSKHKPHYDTQNADTENCNNYSN